jgi:hypothetical protein
MNGLAEDGGESRLIQQRTPDFAEAVDRLAQVIKPPSSVPNGFDAPMADDANERAKGTAKRILGMASEFGLIGVSVERVSSDVAPAEGEIVLIEAEEEA